jgi:hypothetical protein
MPACFSGVNATSENQRLCVLLSVIQDLRSLWGLNLNALGPGYVSLVLNAVP